MVLCVWLNITGGLLEIAGFALVAYELFRTQRRELGDPKPLVLVMRAQERLVAFLRKLLRKPREVTIKAEPATAYAVGGSVKIKIRQDRGQTLEDHVAALESNVAELEKEVETHRRELDEAIAGVSKDLKEMQVALELQRQERKEEDQEILRTSVTLQWWGIGLFVAGVAASVAANVVSCS